MLDPILEVRYRPANHSFMIMGSRMTVWVFAGSKGGGLRTISRLLLAAGACDLALHPLRVRVLLPGRAPALRNVRQVQLYRASISANDAELVAAQTRLLVLRRPKCFPVIVDMLCKRI